MKITTPRDGPSGLTGGGDRYEALLQVMQHEAAQAERSRAFEEEERRKRQRRRTVPASVVVVLAVLAAWIWLFPPAILQPPPAVPQPLAQEAAAVRFTMYVQAQRIRAFQLERGRLPVSLEEAGPPLPAMEYVVLAPGLYQLNGATERVTLTYRSDLPLSEFAGSGADVMGVRLFP